MLGYHSAPLPFLLAIRQQTMHLHHLSAKLLALLLLRQMLLNHSPLLPAIMALFLLYLAKAIHQVKVCEKKDWIDRCLRDMRLETKRIRICIL